MHKCNNCGREFEGNFCPDCGAGINDRKTCPNCGATLAGNANFCNQCGYSFAGDAPAGNFTTVKVKQPNKVSVWIKTHLKVLIPSVAVLVVAIILLSCIPTFILASKNGTYYAYDSYGDELDSSSYITLSTGKWKDSDGGSGTYKLKGEVITHSIIIAG